MRRGGGVGFAVCGFWLLQGLPGCGARSALLSDFAGEGGAGSALAGAFGGGGKAATSGGRAGAGPSNGGTSAAAGTPSASAGQPTILGGSGGSGGRVAAGGFGGGSLGGNAGSHAGSAGQAGAAPLCEGEQGYSENLTKCAQGFVHRERALACPLPALDAGGAAGAGGRVDDVACPPPVLRCAINEECQNDGDCPSGAYCVALHWFSFDALELTTACLFPCRDDSECYDTELCACSQFTRASTGALIELGSCRSAGSCKVDADCGPDQLCVSPLDPVPFAPEMPPNLSFFSCTSPRDECRGYEDCPPSSDASCCTENLCSRIPGQDHLECNQTEHCPACK